ncbi:MAG: hypothetical protein QOI98_1631 [Solirubrobacteraceae bacterium]|nr:hypothetical protein [Solirubrobacteraceae bacterium]
MQDWFATVLFGVVVFGVVIGLITLVVRGRLYDQIGRGGLSLDQPDTPSRPPAPTSAAGLRERDEEIRQMLAARNERRARRGEAPLDVETELAKLTVPAPSADPGLVEEVRQLVVARNERRARKGESPLDVEAEVERQLRELGA